MEAGNLVFVRQGSRRSSRQDAFSGGLPKNEPVTFIALSLSLLLAVWSLELPLPSHRLLKSIHDR